MASGMLTGKIRRDHRPDDARLGQREMPHYRRYFTDHAFAVVDAVTEAARTLHCTPAQVAIAWQLARPEVTSVIIGAPQGTILTACLFRNGRELDTHYTFTQREPEGFIIRALLPERSAHLSAGISCSDWGLA